MIDLDRETLAKMIDHTELCASVAIIKALALEKLAKTENLR